MVHNSSRTAARTHASDFNEPADMSFGFGYNLGSPQMISTFRDCANVFDINPSYEGCSSCLTSSKKDTMNWDSVSDSTICASGVTIHMTEHAQYCSIDGLDTWYGQEQAEYVESGRNHVAIFACIVYNLPVPNVTEAIRLDDHGSSAPRSNPIFRDLLFYSQWMTPRVLALWSSGYTATLEETLHSVIEQIE